MKVDKTLGTSSLDSDSSTVDENNIAKKSCNHHLIQQDNFSKDNKSSDEEANVKHLGKEDLKDHSSEFSEITYVILPTETEYSNLVDSDEFMVISSESVSPTSTVYALTSKSSSLSKSNSAIQSSENILEIIPSSSGNVTAIPRKSVSLVSTKNGPTEIQRRIIKLLETIIENQCQHSAILKRLVPPAMEIMQIPQNLPELPVNSFHQLNKWESFLSNAQNFSNAVKYFSNKVMAGEESYLTRRLLSMIMSDEFAVNFNWAGRSLKRPFKRLKTMSFIFSTVRQNLSSKEYSGRDIENAIKEWLKKAIFRSIYIKKKAQKKLQDNNFEQIEIE